MLTTVLDVIAATLLTIAAGLLVGTTVAPPAGVGAACGVAGLLIAAISWRLTRGAK